MSHDYVAPDFGVRAFNCPFCNAYAEQVWLGNLLARSKNFAIDVQTSIEPITIAVCQACRDFSCWIGNRMIYPSASIAPFPSEDMPEDVAKDYNEARLVYALSPKASAALLRLALQRLCIHFGEPGKDINADIGALVKKGLPPAVQRAMDIVRVVGNEAVHPGTMDINDTPQIALRLFNLVNMVVHDMITRPKELEEDYNILPQNKLDGIATRDRNALAIAAATPGGA